MLKKEVATIAASYANQILKIMQNINDLTVFDDQGYIHHYILSMPEFYRAIADLEAIKEELKKEV